MQDAMTMALSSGRRPQARPAPVRRALDRRMRPGDMAGRAQASVMPLNQDTDGTIAPAGESVSVGAALDHGRFETADARPAPSGRTVRP